MFQRLQATQYQELILPLGNILQLTSTSQVCLCKCKNYTHFMAQSEHMKNIAQIFHVCSLIKWTAHWYLLTYFGIYINGIVWYIRPNTSYVLHCVTRGVSFYYVCTVPIKKGLWHLCCTIIKINEIECITIRDHYSCKKPRCTLSYQPTWLLEFLVLEITTELLVCYTAVHRN